MPENLRSSTLRQWLSHSENTTGGFLDPVFASAHTVPECKRLQ